jgi:hypothetical protein
MRETVMNMRNKILGLLSLFVVTGCSTTPHQTTRAQVDENYINQVEAAAKKNSLSPRIYWVNPPLKKEPAEQ